MSAELFTVPFQCVVVSGLAVPGATITFYGTGTSTKLPIYTTSSLITQQTNPVVANGAGNIPDTYLDDTQTYRVVIKNKAGTVLDDIDPYVPGVTTLGITLTSATGQSVNSRGALAALSPVVNNQVAFLTEVGREGMFVFDTSNLSAFVTADPQQGIYVGPASASTGASGAWVRRFRGHLDARWFGVTAGAANSATGTNAAITWSIANGIPVDFPDGSINLGSAITVTGNYFQIYGNSWGGTVFKPTTAAPAFILKGRYGLLKDCGFDGTTAGTYGIVVKDANSTIVDNCDCRHFDNDGMLIDPTYGGGADGNNNSFKVRTGHYGLNGGCGIRMVQHGDNNNVSYEGVDMSGNASHGLLGKSSKFIVDSACIFEGNGGYGIQIGEDADGSTNIDSLIDSPWVEANGSGGIRGSASSANNTIRLFGQGQSYTRNASAANSVSRVSSGGINAVGSVDGDSFVRANAVAGEAYVLAYSISGGNVNLNLGGAGTGTVVFSSSVGAITSTGAISAAGDVVSTAGKTGVAPVPASLGGAYLEHGAGSGYVASYNSSGVRQGYGFFLSGTGLLFDCEGTATRFDFADPINLSATVLKVNDVQVVGAQGAAVANATDAASAISQLNALLARCRTHGLIAT